MVLASVCLSASKLNSCLQSTILGFRGHSLSGVEYGVCSMSDNKEVQAALDSIKQRKMSSASLRHFEITKLHCYGCAHSASSEPFPSKPSGERPCFFCIRNPERVKWQTQFKERQGSELKEWYDGTPIAFYPLDAYQTLDMLEQEKRFERKRKGETNWNEPDASISFG